MDPKTKLSFHQTKKSFPSRDLVINTLSKLLLEMVEATALELAKFVWRSMERLELGEGKQVEVVTLLDLV